MANLEERVDQLFAEWDRPDSPGCALGAIRDGELVYKNGYGAGDLEAGTPLTPQSVFYIASVSKQFTAACILLLEQQGKLSLDDDIRRHVPEMPQYEEPITLRHLVHHTSGLRDYLDLLELAGRNFAEAFDNADGMAILCRQRELNFKPGEKHLYCNSGYKLMAEIVGRVSGLALRPFAKREIFAPLGMAHTHFDDDNSPAVENRVLSYRPDAETGFVPLEKNFTIVGSGGLLTTVEDLLLWDRNFYEPKVGGDSFVETMQRCGTLNSGEELDYTAGLVVGEYKGLRLVHHSGSMLGFRTIMARFPAQKFTVVLLGNLGTIDTWKLMTQVTDIYLADHYRLDEFAGEYHSEELAFTYRLATAGSDPFLPYENAPSDPLASVGRDKFRVGNRNMHFERDESGRVQGFSVSTERAQNLRFVRA